MSKTAFITGLTGQDGSYLAELLLEKDYTVHGLLRRSSTVTTGRIEHLLDRVHVHYGDLSDAAALRRILETTRPDEVYNLAAQSHVGISFSSPLQTCDSGALGTLRLLEAIRDLRDRTGQEIKFYQASSSEMFGRVRETPQSESTQFYPRSPYAVGKVFSYWMTVNYREAYGIHGNNGILFNHESPRRGENFVTRKITRAVGRIKLGLQQELRLGNIDAQRDWGYAGDYVEAMYLMMQQPAGDDYVVATGSTYSVREFLEYAFGHVGLDYNDFVVIDPKFFRPTEVELLLGDPSRTREKLGWQPKVDCRGLAEMMVESDMEMARREKSINETSATFPTIGGVTGVPQTSGRVAA